MSRVLLANEFGDGFGHAMRLRRVAERLREGGHECIFAVRDPVSIFPVINQIFGVLQAPHTPIVLMPAWRNRTVVTYGDILATFGFTDPSRLLPLTQAWQSLLDLIAPDLIVADFAPTLCLASYPDRPLVLLGNGYTLPPAHLRDFPTLREAEPLASEEEVLEAVRAVQQERGRPTPETLPGLFAVRDAFVTTLPELDPYDQLRMHPAIGPLSPLPAPAIEPPTSDYFAYLSATYAGTFDVLDALASSGFRGSVYLRDASSAHVEEWRDKGLVLHNQPVALGEAVTAAALVIHHGGPATLETSLAAGRPQLLVPRHFEQTLYAKAALRLGVAVAMRPHSKFRVDHVRGALERVLNSEAMREAAVGQADRLAALGPFQGLDIVTDRCLKLLTS